MAQFQCQVFNTKPQATSFAALRQTCDALLQSGASLSDVLAGLAMVQAYWAAKAAESQYSPKLVQPAPPGLNGPRMAEP